MPVEQPVLDTNYETLKSNSRIIMNEKKQQREREKIYQ